MFLDGQKLHPYIPMAKARGFTGAVDKTINYTLGELDITFYENWPEEYGAADYIETSYTYDDFNGIIDYETSSDGSEETIKFRLFMI